MVLKSDKDLGECRQEFQDAFRSTQIYGRIWRWRGKYVFYITNRRHWRRTSRDPGYGFLTAVSCRGTIVPSGSGVKIRVGFVYGLNLFELVFMWSALFLCLLYASKSRYEGVPLHVVVLLALGISAIYFIIAFFSSVCSLLGSDDKGELMYFLTSNLQAEYCLDDT